MHEVAQEGALARATAIARDLARKPPGALAAAKALVKNREDHTLDAAGARSRGRFLTLLKNDPDAQRLMQRFLSEGEDINRS